MQSEHECRPPGANSERRDVLRLQQMLIQPQVIRVEEALRDQTLLQYAVGQGEHDDTRPTESGTSVSPHGDQHGASPIHRRQNH